MSKSLEHVQTPEEVELELKRTELSRLEAQLAQRELDLETLRAELFSFERQYMQVVGIRLAELDQVEAEIAVLLSKANPANAEIRAKAETAREQAQGSAEAAREAAESGARLDFKPSDELKKLYREVAKQIHPDLANDDSEKEKRHRLMAEASEAYRNGDIARLQQILCEWQHSPEAVKGEGAGADLVRVIRKSALIRNRLAAIDSEVEVLKTSELYELREQVASAKKAGRDLLKDMEASVEEDIAAARHRLNRMAIKGNAVRD